MKRLITRIATWVLRRWNAVPVEIVLRDHPAVALVQPYLEAAATLCTKVQVEAPEAAGEWKRHQVYARLLKQFPVASHRDLALALELSVREME